MRRPIVLLFASLVAGLWIEPSSASETTTYRNDRLGFEVTYLSSWEQSQAPGNPALFIKRKSAEEPATVTINVANFSGNKDTFMGDLKANPNEIVKNYKRRFPDVEMLENGETYLGGFPAYYISVGYTVRNLNFNVDVLAMQIFCIKDQRIFLVNFETPLAILETTFSEFQAILATFNFR